MNVPTKHTQFWEIIILDILCNVWYIFDIGPNEIEYLIVPHNPLLDTIVEGLDFSIVDAYLGFQIFP